MPKVSFAGCRSGGAAVEFALLAPFLLLMFGGITGFGICLGAKHDLRQVAGQAARAMVAGVTDDERAALAKAAVDAGLRNGSAFRPGAVSVTVSRDPADADVTVVTLTLDGSTIGLGAFRSLVPMIPGGLSGSVRVRRGVGGSQA